MLERNQPFYKVRLAKHRSLFAIPVPELAKAMNIAPGRAVQVCKAAYGLVNAPAEFFKAVCDCLTSLGFEQLVTEPCAGGFELEVQRRAS